MSYLDPAPLTNRWYMVRPNQSTANWACTCHVQAIFKDDKATCPVCNRTWSLKSDKDLAASK